MFHVQGFLKEMITICAVIVLEQMENLILKSVQQDNIINQGLSTTRTRFVQGAVLVIFMLKQRSGMFKVIGFLFVMLVFAVIGAILCFIL